MKKSQSLKRTLAVVLSMSVLSFSMITCKNPVEGLQLNMNSAGIFNNTIAVRFENANPNSAEYAPGSTLKVRIEGEDAADIFSMGGSKQFIPANGFLNLVVNPNAVATNQNPIRFNIVATASGYLPVTKEVIISGNGDVNVSVPMVNLTDLPQGVDAKQMGTTLGSDGKAPSDIIVTGTPSSSKPEAFEVKIGSNIAMMDETGNPVSGNVTVTAVHFDDRSESAIIAKPGGFLASKLVDPAGNPLPSVALETMGSVSLTIVADNGTKVKKFSEPIDLTIDINPTSKHPKTGALIKEGDSIPVFSRDEETGVWTLEGSTVVRKAPNSNKLVANVKVPHLSDWEVAFFTNSPDGSCDNPTVTINYTGNTDIIFIEIYNNRTGKIIGGPLAFVIGNGENKIQIPSQNVQAYAIAYKGRNKINLAAFSLCGGSASATLEGEVNPKVDIEIKAVCGDVAAPTRTIYPTFQVMYKETGSTNRFEVLGNVTNGKISTTKFKQGLSYTFGASYEGRWYEYTRLIDQTSYNETMPLPPTNNVCK